MKKFLTITLLLALAAGFCLAQSRRSRSSGWSGGSIRTEGGVMVDEDTVRTAREVAVHSTDIPNWTNAPGFSHDTFTFVRIIRDSAPYSSGAPWVTDFPDSDLNLSYRLQQMTSLKVDPNGRVMRLTNPALFDYPWIYMVEPGSLVLRDEEVPILRKYLLNGGVLWVDDFWGEAQWAQLAREIKRVLPEKEFTELPMDHPVFHSVFDLNVPKSKLQTPNYRQGTQSQYDGVTWEYHDGEECREMHVRAITDDKGRILVFATHNCDNGDGWEREGENDYFFHEFSEKRAYPLGINVIFYLMTH